MGLRVPGARFVVESLPAAGEERLLGRDKASHARARRLVSGDEVVLVDGSGREAHGRVAKLGRAGLTIAVERVVRGAADGLPPVHLAVGAVRPERLAWIAEKATELGAESLWLVVSERTQGPRAGASIVPRLQRVVEEAAEQSERARWPRIEGPASFAFILDGIEAPQRILLDSGAEPFPERLAPRETLLLIGPEGGWTESERAAALDAGWTEASIPAGKLRTETAAVSAIALARSALARGSH
jgi:16S rRNA (uracil1498-N3)-methyltransferase